MIHEEFLKDDEREALKEADRMMGEASDIRRRIRKRCFDRFRRAQAKEGMKAK